MSNRALGLIAILVALLTLPFPGTPPAGAATLSVSDCGDSGGPNQLRQVIAAAAPGDTINIVACTVTLTTAASPLIISKSVTINGAGAQNTIIDGGNITQIFRVSPGTPAVAMSGMTLRKGNSTLGGAILNQGALTLTNMLVTANTASGDGGGINGNSGGSQTLINSTVSGNTGGLGGGAGGRRGP